MLCGITFPCTSQIWPCSNGLEPRSPTHLGKDNFSGFEMCLVELLLFILSLNTVTSIQYTPPHIRTRPQPPQVPGEEVTVSQM